MFFNELIELYVDFLKGLVGFCKLLIFFQNDGFEIIDLCEQMLLHCDLLLKVLGDVQLFLGDYLA
jgi:hypothetical protein